MKKHSFLEKMSKNSSESIPRDLYDKLTVGENLSEDEIDTAIESLETKVYNFEINEPHENSKKVLLEASNPHTTTIIENILSKILKNENCNGVTVVTEGFASKSLGKFQDRDAFSYKTRAENSPVFSDISGDVDVCLAFLEEPENSPLLPMLYSAKSIFGAKKLFVYVTGPGLQSNFRERFSPERRKIMDEIDGLITSSDLSAIAISELIQFPIEKIFVVEDPIVGVIENQPKEFLRNEGRRKIGLHDNDITLLYLGFPSKPTENIGMAHDLNLRTLKEVIAGSLLAANQEPQKRFVIIVRAHPRDPDGEEMQNIIPGICPENIRFIFDKKLTFDEAIYASDGVISTPLSTEIHLASHRGRTAIMSSFQGKGLTGDLVNNIYTENTLGKILTQPGIEMAKDAAGLADILKGLKIFEPIVSLDGSLKIDSILLS